MEPTDIPFSALAGSAPRTAPRLFHPRLCDDDKKKQKSRGPLRLICIFRLILLAVLSQNVVVVHTSQLKHCLYPGQ